MRLRDNCVFGPSGSVSLRAIAQAYYLSPGELPSDIDAHGLEVTGGFSPSCITGIHTGSAHAAVVAVDPETGAVEILDYVVAEDAGTLVNPMIVDGQIFGGTAQGIGSALYRTNAIRQTGPAVGVDAGRLSVAGQRRSSRTSVCCTWKRRHPTLNSASRVLARAALSVRPRQLPTPSMTRCGRCTSRLPKFR